jgi:uncharacterized membrane-anchored protein
MHDEWAAPFSRIRSEIFDKREYTPDDGTHVPGSGASSGEEWGDISSDSEVEGSASTAASGKDIPVEEPASTRRVFRNPEGSGRASGSSDLDSVRKALAKEDAAKHTPRE